MAVDKTRLHALFAEGKSDAEIAVEFERAPSTITYHRKVWEKAGRPGLKVSESESVVVTPEPEPQPVEPVSLVPAAEVHADPPTPEEEQPVPPDMVKQLQEKFAPVTAGSGPQKPPQPKPQPPKQSKPAVQWNPPAKAKRTLQEGEWYEGAVAVIGDNWVLIDLVELADDQGHSPRGILHQSKAGDGINPAMVYKVGSLVDVKVVEKRFNPKRQKLDITLTTDDSSNALVLPVAKEHSLPTPPAPSSPIPKPAPPQLPPLPTAAPPAPLEEPISYRPSPHLCDTCVKADVCPVVQMLIRVVETADLGYYNSLGIKTRPLQLESCTGYRAEEVR